MPEENTEKRQRGVRIVVLAHHFKHKGQRFYKDDEKVIPKEDADYLISEGKVCKA